MFVKHNWRRRIIAGVAVLAAAAFAGGAYTARHDPAAGTRAFMREVAKRMNLTPSQLRTTVERPAPRPRHDVRTAIFRPGPG
jgi:hypothetical protein